MMKKLRKPMRRTAPSLPMMFVEMVTTSVETIARWTGMMATERCSAAEYQRMVVEKAKAAIQPRGVPLPKAGSKSILF